MKITPTASNAIYLELDNGSVLRVIDGGQGRVTIIGLADSDQINQTSPRNREVWASQEGSYWITLRIGEE